MQNPENKKKIVSYQAAATPMKVDISILRTEDDPQQKGYDIAVSYNGIPVGTIVLCSESDLRMLSNCLQEFVEEYFKQ